jgi:hypothetical protein
MFSVVPLLIDDPDLPREARDLLIASEYSGRRPAACVARKKVAEILGSRYALSREELESLLDLGGCRG